MTTVQLEMHQIKYYVVKDKLRLTTVRFLSSVRESPFQGSGENDLSNPWYSFKFVSRRRHRHSSQLADETADIQAAGKDLYKMALSRVYNLPTSSS